MRMRWADSSSWRGQAGRLPASHSTPLPAGELRTPCQAATPAAPQGPQRPGSDPGLTDHSLVASMFICPYSRPRPKQGACCSLSYMGTFSWVAASAPSWPTALSQVLMVSFQVQSSLHLWQKQWENTQKQDTRDLAEAPGPPHLFFYWDTYVCEKKILGDTILPHRVKHSARRQKTLGQVPAPPLPTWGLIALSKCLIFLICLLSKHEA